MRLVIHLFTLRSLPSSAFSPTSDKCTLSAALAQSMKSTVAALASQGLLCLGAAPFCPRTWRQPPGAVSLLPDSWKAGGPEGQLRLRALQRSGSSASSSREDSRGIGSLHTPAHTHRSVQRTHDQRQAQEHHHHPDKGQVLHHPLTTLFSSVRA